MVRNYIKIAFRNLWKHKSFSAINIAGLAAGLTACFFILSYVRFELSYDNFHSKGDRIVRLRDDVITPTETIENGISPYPVGPAIAEEFPEVESFVRVARQELIFVNGDKKFKEKDIVLADSTFFRIFDFPWLKGCRNMRWPRLTALCSRKRPPAVISGGIRTGEVHTGPTGRQDPFLTVTGIMAPMPENSQIHADAVISLSTLREAYEGSLSNWTNHAPYTYLLLKPETDYKTLQARFPLSLKGASAR